jgi:hypothetical protein
MTAMSERPALHYETREMRINDKKKEAEGLKGKEEKFAINHPELRMSRRGL